MMSTRDCDDSQPKEVLMASKMSCVVCLLSASLFFSCTSASVPDDSPPVLRVVVPPKGSESEITLRFCGPPRTVLVGTVRRQVFPEVFTTDGETIEGIEYQGMILEGDGDRVRLLAARDPSCPDAVRVIVDSSITIELQVWFMYRTEGEGKRKKHVEVSRVLKAGEHHLKLAKPGRKTGGRKRWEEKGTGNSEDTIPIMGSCASSSAVMGHL
jgi:hypothetical protein